MIQSVLHTLTYAGGWSFNLQGSMETSGDPLPGSKNEQLELFWTVCRRVENGCCYHPAVFPKWGTPQTSRSDASWCWKTTGFLGPFLDTPKLACLSAIHLHDVLTLWGKGGNTQDPSTLRVSYFWEPSGTNVIDSQRLVRGNFNDFPNMIVWAVIKNIMICCQKFLGMFVNPLLYTWIYQYLLWL